MAISIVKYEGVFKLYSGLTASLLRQATYSTARFGVYEFLKEQYQRKYNVMPSTAVLLPMSMISGALGGLVGNPSDVVNIRMQNDSALPQELRRNYKNAFEGLFRIVKSVLMTASQVVTYDISKNFLVDCLSMDSSKKSTHFSASLMAGLVATTVCSPADVVKTRIMNAQGTSSGALSILTTAVKAEGPAFMFRGWLPSFIRLGPHTIATFLVLEQLRKYRIGMGA
ncbi:hypothetical protein CA7LBN_002702 [Candidozyma auris]|uniref:Mitochondrial dicarboxylate transporter n=1 Tax=Candidozyma auris TaxID=498019 RepID=A0A8F2W196_CANAR|nr:hypothetical protein CA7LBN_002702 [[Candida] auris]